MRQTSYTCQTLQTDGWTKSLQAVESRGQSYGGVLLLRDATENAVLLNCYGNSSLRLSVRPSFRDVEVL